jgi:hypothetical protein
MFLFFDIFIRPAKIAVESHPDDKKITFNFLELLIFSVVKNAFVDRKSVV